MSKIEKATCIDALRNPRRGFTLIEMLVASALVVLMMTIFAEVFQMASGSMTLQRTIAENDQQVRTITTIMRGDLQKRTFRNIAPFFPRESFDRQGLPFSDRQGYFYLSSNDPNRGDDTVLQFTVDANINTETADDTPYFGKAELLSPQFTGTPQQVLDQKVKYLRLNPNQPESDDGQVSLNGSTSSSAAEVCYFVRNGILYRRVVLLRQPLSSTSPTSGTITIQPTKVSPSPSLGYFSLQYSLNYPSPNPNYHGDFNYWNSFDVAAYRDPLSDTPMLLGMDANESVLNNQLSSSSSTPLGRSRYRFGFDNSYVVGPPTSWTLQSGLSREFFGAGNSLFLGRFTHEETSSANFKYPCTSASANPFATSTALADSDNDGVVDAFKGGARVGEDILITHVHSFEVEFFDDRLQAFAPVGHTQTTISGVPGDYHFSRLLNSDYVPAGAGIAPGRVFDTWHPWYDRNGAGAGDSSQVFNYSQPMQQDRPPYRAMTWDPAGESAPVPSNPGGRPTVWQPAVDYQVNDIVFPPTEDTNYDGVLDADGQFGYQNDSAIDSPGGEPLVPAQPYGRVYYYICRRSRLDPNNPAQVPNSYTNQPLWGSSPGVLFGHKDTANPNTPNMAQWEAVLNLRPVRAIRMTVRFLHRGSNKLRQMTLVHSVRN